MSILFGGSKPPVATQPNILQAIRVTSSSYGQGLPIVYGQNRIAGMLIWSGDFVAIAQTSKTSSGGKGLGGGKTTTTTYDYQTAIAIALCEGPIAQICNVWDTKGTLLLVSAVENFTVPGGGGSYQVTNHANYFAQYGVARKDTYSVTNNDYGSDGPVTLTGTQNTPMTLVGSSPGAGQFTLNTGTATFTFSAADAGKQVQITYVYSIPNSNSNGQPLQQLTLTFFNGARPQTPWAYLTSNHPGQDLGYNGVAYVADQSMDLGSSGSIPNYNYEVLGLLPFGGGITDCDPGAVVNDLLTNPFYGMGWSSGFIGDYSNFSAYCQANGLFFSPVIDTQQTAASILDDLIDLANGAAIWSEGVVKIKTYGDITAVANGAIFIPNTEPEYDLADRDFIEKKNVDPIQIVRKSPSDRFNDIKIEFLDRSNSYNISVAEDKDDASIALYGLKADNPRQAHAICDATVAKKVANIKKKRAVYIDGGNQYRFTLGWQYILLEPMDLVTLTDANLGLSKHPVRITAIKENDTGELDFEAEDFPWGTATPTAYPFISGGGFNPNQQADPGALNTPIIFEANNRLSRVTQYEVWMGLSGAVPANWGGCHVWVSIDNTTYLKVGTLRGASRMGVTTSSLAGAVAISTIQAVFSGTTLIIVATVAPHGFSPGASVSISGVLGTATPFDLDGTFIINSVPNPYTFDILLSHSSINDSGYGGSASLTSTLGVDLTESAGTLSSGSQTDADNFRTAMWVDGEVISYETATLTSQYKYTLSYLVRAALSSAGATHSSGVNCLRLDDAVFVWEYDPTLVGTTVYFKFTSFNQFELMEQSLANVSAHSIVLQGPYNGAARVNFANPVSFAAVTTSTSITIYWDGTNGSSKAQVYRDDNTVTAQASGNTAVTGLTPNTTYYFYPYYDPSTGLVLFVSDAGPNGGGNAGIALTGRVPWAAQQQALMNRVPLSTGPLIITTPTSGGGVFTGTGGGGGRDF